LAQIVSIVCSFRALMDREGTGVRAACHVLLLTGLCVAGQEDARRAVGEEDRNRVVVGLGEELPGGEAMTSVRTPPQSICLPARSTSTFKPSLRTPRKDP
jgi:hypothetical protein